MKFFQIKFFNSKNANFKALSDPDRSSAMIEADRSIKLSSEFPM